MPSGKNATLTPKQKKFADAYIKSGNAAESYQSVYKCKATTARANGATLLTNTNIKEYILQINKKIEKSSIADMIEIKEFWTKIFREGRETIEYDGKKISKIVDIKDRLKASEYIAKTNAAFIENTNVNITPVTIVRGDPNAKRG